MEVWVSPGAGNEDDWRQEITFWKNASVTHVTAHTTYIRGTTDASTAELRRSTWQRSFPLAVAVD